MGPLAVIYRDAKLKKTERLFATETLADYAAGPTPKSLVDLLADAEQFQFPVIFAKLAAHQTQAISLAETELAKRAEDEASEDEKERLAKRQANSAVALLRMGKAGQRLAAAQVQPRPTSPQLPDPLDQPVGGRSADDHQATRRSSPT